jgi:hypothetical protein
MPMNLRILKTEQMRIRRYAGSIVLGAALIAPVGMLAGTNFQDDQHRDDKNQKRYYDSKHKDYHTGMIGKPLLTSDGQSRIIPITRTSPILKRKDQSEYWNWRHDHPDDDRDRH